MKSAMSDKEILAARDLLTKISNCSRDWGMSTDPELTEYLTKALSKISELEAERDWVRDELERNYRR